MTGYVRNPGAQRVRGPLSISQAVALGGGYDVAANREEVIIHRHDGTTEEVSLVPDTAAGTPPQRTLLYPGDILEVKKEFQINWSLVTTFAYILISGIGIIIQLTR